MSTTNQAKHETTNPLRSGLIGRFQRTFIDVLHVAEPSSIYEVGCGEGYLLSIIHKHFPTVPLLGCDNNAGALAEGRRLFPELQFADGDIFHLPQADKSWDVVIASEVLEHLDRPEDALRELRRVAKRYVLLSVPHEPWFRFGNLSHGRHIRRIGNHPEHVNTWTRNGFARMVRRVCRPVIVTGSIPWTIILASV